VNGKTADAVVRNGGRVKTTTHLGEYRMISGVLFINDVTSRMDSLDEADPRLVRFIVTFPPHATPRKVSLATWPAEGVDKAAPRPEWEPCSFYDAMAHEAGGGQIQFLDADGKRWLAPSLSRNTDSFWSRKVR